MEQKVRKKKMKEDNIKLKNKFNVLYKDYKRSNIKYDKWLELFDNELIECNTPIIDLGCGSGNNVLYLIEKGKEIIPCDYSENAIESIKVNFPEIKKIKCFDMIDGLPFVDNYTDIIISDLSLHYFSKATTMYIIDEIKRVLKPNGILLIRVNHINDFNNGTKKIKEIEKHYYETEDGRFKRFFDRNDIVDFFKNWDIQYINEEIMKRYGNDKIVWECKIKVKK